MIPFTKTLEYDAELTLNDDGNRFKLIETNSEEFKYKISEYDLLANLISEEIIGEDQHVIGLNMHDYNEQLLELRDPMLQPDILERDNALENMKSPSFSEVHVEYMINHEASSSDIKDRLKTFFSRAKSNDQVMIFLAGHGVLDRDLNYYFAPHDMDFSDISSKGIEFKNFISALNQSRAVNKLLLMDSCHSGNTLDLIDSSPSRKASGTSVGARGSKGQSTSATGNFKVSEIVGDLFEDFLSTSGVTVISAASGGDVALENKALGNGAFTSAYLDLLKSEIKGNDYVLDEENLSKSIDFRPEYVNDILKSVLLKTNGKQAPDLREFDKNSRLKFW